MCGHWTTGVVIELFSGYWINKKKKLGFVNIVNTNTFFIPTKNSLKVTLIWILTVQHLNTQNVITGEGYKFFGHTFLEGAGFLGC